MLDCAVDGQISCNSVSTAVDFFQSCRSAFLSSALAGPGDNGFSALIRRLFRRLRVHLRNRVSIGLNDASAPSPPHSLTLDITRKLAAVCQARVIAQLPQLSGQCIDGFRRPGRAAAAAIL
jgi:hypothetical protein